MKNGACRELHVFERVSWRERAYGLKYSSVKKPGFKPSFTLSLVLQGSHVGKDKETTYPMAISLTRACQCHLYQKQQIEFNQLL